MVRPEAAARCSGRWGEQGVLSDFQPSSLNNTLVRIAFVLRLALHSRSYP